MTYFLENRSGESKTGAVFVEVSFNAHQSIESIGTVPSDRRDELKQHVINGFRICFRDHVNQTMQHFPAHINPSYNLLYACPLGRISLIVIVSSDMENKTLKSPTLRR